MADKFIPIDNPDDPRLQNTPLNPTDSGEECGKVGQDTPVDGYRPTAPHDGGWTWKTNANGESVPSTGDSEEPSSVEPDSIQKDCTKPDTPTTVKKEYTVLLDPNDKVDNSLRKIHAAKQLPNSDQVLKNLATQMTGGGGGFGSGFVPPSNNIITSIFGGSSNQNILSEISNLTGSLNRLVNFSSLSTPELRMFIQIFSSIPGIKGLESLPYFNPLSESIGSSITFLTDASGLKQNNWILNAASGLQVTTPISKLNRSKIHPGVVESIDKVFQDLNHSVDLNLGQIFSQYAGFLSMFGNLLGFLPSQITGILGPILGQAQSLLGPLKTLGSGGGGATNIVGQAAGFVSQIFGAYTQIAATAHGLDMIVDVLHHQRVLNVQTQMLSNLSSKFGDQLRVLNNHFPVKGGVKIGNTITKSSIHGYETNINMWGDKILYTHYTDSILNAMGAIT